MGLLLFALFVGIPLLEIMLFIQVGGAIGLGPTILTVIVTAMIGSFLLRRQGLAVMRDAQTSLDRVELPVDSVIHAIFLVVAGAFLLTPGFLTDGLGFLLFVPQARLAIGRALWKFLSSRAEIVTVKSAEQRYYSSDTIDGEAEEIDEGRQ